MNGIFHFFVEGFRGFRTFCVRKIALGFDFTNTLQSTKLDVDNLTKSSIITLYEQNCFSRFPDCTKASPEEDREGYFPVEEWGGESSSTW